jgi:hypothetical protein
MSMSGDISETNGTTIINFHIPPQVIAVRVVGTGNAVGGVNQDSTTDDDSVIVGGGDPWVVKEIGGIKKICLMALAAGLTYVIQIIQQGNAS